MAPNGTRYDLIDGPSKWDLAVSLLDTEAHHRKFVSFKVKNGDVYHIVIDSLGSNDEEKAWNFTSFSRGVTSHGRYIAEAKIVQGCFSLGRRDSHIFVRDHYPRG